MTKNRSSVLIHYHIFKNAGTSVDFALQKLFGSAWTTFEGRDAHDVLSADQMRDFLAKNPGVKAVSSHLARPPLPYASCVPIVFLRHPVLRAESVFNFVKQDASQPNHTIIREYDFRSYVDAVLSGRINGVVIRNYQTIHLSDASFRNSTILNASAFEYDYRQAVELLSNWSVFGIVERFEESLELFSACYAKHLEGRSFPVTRLNHSQNQLAECNSIADQLEGVKEQLGESLYDALEAENAIDMQLYSWASKVFAARYSNQAIISHG